MPHTLIIGMTASGKSTVAKKQAQKLYNMGYNILVYDPLLDNWPCTFITDDPEHFIDVAHRSINCYLFIDEADTVVSHAHKKNFWLATRSRHLGHSVTFITQRGALISPTVRGQCAFLFLFRSPTKDCKILAEEFGHEELIDGGKLGQFEYYFTGRYFPCKKHFINHKSKRSKT